MNSLKCLILLAVLDPNLARLAWQTKRYKKTYLGYSEILSLIRNYLTVYKRYRKPFDCAEFGVGRGGSAQILAFLTNRYGGRLVLFDVFGLIPHPTEIDGVKAIERYKYIIESEGDDYYGNIPHLKELIINDISRVCDLSKVEFIEGEYEHKLRELIEKRSFGFVHIDCDWYESYKAVINYLENNIGKSAILQLDDYLTWEGTARIVAETKWLSTYKKWIVNTALVIDTAQYETPKYDKIT